MGLIQTNATPYSLKKFTKLFNTYFPMQKFRLNKTNSPRSEWITKGLIKSCKKRSKLYKQYQLDPLNSTKKDRYLIYRNKLNSLLRKAERDYYNQKLISFNGNLSKTWKTIRQIINKTKADNFLGSLLLMGIN